MAGVNSGSGGVGVYGTGNGYGVYGIGDGYGVYGISNSSSGSGVGAINTSFGDALFVYEQSGGYAAFFDGNVDVDGNLSKAGGSFKIDHPLDPANKYLYHSFVESPDMMNIYNGNVTTDAQAARSGPAAGVVRDPEPGFSLSTHSHRPVRASHRGSEISNHPFTIKTDKPNVKFPGR